MNKNFVLISNQRCGSTWFITSLGNCQNIQVDFEIKWSDQFMSAKKAPHQIFLKNDNFKNIFNKLKKEEGDNIFGTKYVFDFYKRFPLEDYNHFLEKFRDIKIINLRRNYIEILKSKLIGGVSHLINKNYFEKKRNIDNWIYKNKKKYINVQQNANKNKNIINFEYAKNYLINLFLIQQIMPKARYDINKDSHWGLDLKNYSHFTSPIRRFSDLINHYLLFNEEFSKLELLNITRIINKNEDDQQKLSYELINIKRFQNLKANELNYKSKKLSGIIINVSNPRILVFIKDLFISQEIHVAKFSNNRLNFDEIKKEYIGEVNLFIGKEINLEIIKINYCSRLLEFEIS